jgi:hypothetical protein
MEIHKMIKKNKMIKVQIANQIFLVFKDIIFLQVLQIIVYQII